MQWWSNGLPACWISRCCPFAAVILDIGCFLTVNFIMIAYPRGRLWAWFTGVCLRFAEKDLTQFKCVSE